MLVGREKEIQTLRKAYVEEKPSFIAVYGRRRIGKTYLICETFHDSFTFHISGVYHATLKDHMSHFFNELKRSGYKGKEKPKNWIDAFFMLENFLETKDKDERILIFLDELAWLDTKGSRFVEELANFWNMWASRRKNLTLVVSSSSTSWMLKKIIHNVGGLHGRLTDYFKLEPLTLEECEKLSKSLGNNFNKLELLKLYMVFGGVPYYYEFLDSRLSVDVNIERLFYGDGAKMQTEYQYMIQSLFNNHVIYKNIIELLTKFKSGLTRNEICEKLKLPSSSTITDKLSDLKESCFISSVNNYKNSERNCIYKISDEFILFYNTHVSGREKDNNYWMSMIDTPKYNTWCGFSFERVCFKHINQIKQALHIAAISSKSYSFVLKGDSQNNDNGCQIDMILDRNDGIIDVCEIKFSKSEYNLDLEEYTKINRRIEIFKKMTNTKKSLHSILITTFGLDRSSYNGLVNHVINIEDLFKPTLYFY